MQVFADSSFPSQIVDDTSQRLGVARQTLAVQQPRKQTSAPLFVCSVLWNTFDHHSRHFQFAMLRTIEGMGCLWLAEASNNLRTPPDVPRTGIGGIKVKAIAMQQARFPFLMKRGVWERRIVLSARCNMA